MHVNTTFARLQEKTEYVSSALSNELRFVEQGLAAVLQETSAMEGQARYLLALNFASNKRKSIQVLKIN